MQGLRATGSNILTRQVGRRHALFQMNNLRARHFSESSQEIGVGGSNDVRKGHYGIFCFHVESVLSTAPASNLMSGESLGSDC